MITKILSSIAFVFLLTACQNRQSQTMKSVDSKTFAEKLKATENPQLIDVSTPEEFAAGHIENATNINWNSDNFTKKAERLDKSKPVFLYCKSGNKSNDAAMKLIELGFKEVYDLHGGFTQ